MFDIGASELLMIAIVAVIVIGPKDLPLALRTAGRWIGQMRRISGHFRTGLETMIREAELEELEKKWAEQNAKIMREHPAGTPAEIEPTGAYPARPVAPPAEAEPASSQPAPLQPAPSEPAVPAPAAAEARVIAAGDPAEYQDMPGRARTAEE